MIEKGIMEDGKKKSWKLSHSIGEFSNVENIETEKY